MKTNRPYLRGDLVKVWSLQSFYGGGFIKGKLARVTQSVGSQKGGSVLLIVERKININGKSFDGIDLSYEVYCQQTEFIRHGTKEELAHIEYCIALNKRIREYAQNVNSKRHTPFHYAPEFFFDKNTVLQVNRDLLEYPEMFI